MNKKTNKQFIDELKEVWGDDFIPLETYQGHNKKISVLHKKCGRILAKSPRDLLTYKYDCRSCKARENREKARIAASYNFQKRVSELEGNEYSIESPYISAKDPIKLFHKRCGRVIETTPDSFLQPTRGKVIGRCRYCSDKWKRNTNDFINEVNFLYGSEFEVLDEYKGRHENIVIKHHVCGNIFPVRPRHFLDQKSYCKYCNKKVSKTNEMFKTEVKELVGTLYTFLDEYVDAKTLIRVQHSTCKEVYLVTPDNFLRNRRCPTCHSNSQDSKGQRLIRDFLKFNNIPFIEEYKDSDCKNQRPLRFDFAVFDTQNKRNLLMLIEFDGEQHFKPVDYFGGDEAYMSQVENDSIKDNFAKRTKIPLLRIPYFSIGNIVDILKTHLNHHGIDISA
ncbi:hypothetical protein [Pontibacillus salipaludis]|uniref:DUF2726 domain-containing protein n=1 Tax=Pontibacillus salipaludis TaxID=1697394 RepID=A0ABQ1QJY9_9BACI|nr:hypothetical protein [Pontibacillus salipaludis]GGD29683.1 hypothetical protein GCM10011389_41550 [Pontibacillus salipaludis]